MIRRLRKRYFHATRRKPLCRLDADKATPDDDATLSLLSECMKRVRIGNSAQKMNAAAPCLCDAL